MRSWPFALLLLALPLAPRPAAARQEAPRGVPRFPIEDGPLARSAATRPGAYLADVGRRAAVFGVESGSFEVWTWPLKLVRDLRLAFRIPEYDAPIDGASVARSVTVRPEGATIVYSHATFTVRQHIFVPLDEPGVVILLDVRTVRPLDVLVRMHADFDLAWPGAFGGGFITWQPETSRFLLSQGGVRLYNGMIGSPFAVAGTSHPAHDAPTIPSQFTLRFEPGRAAGEYIPIVAAGGAMPRDSVGATYDRLLANAPRYWSEKVEHYRRVRSELLGVSLPDERMAEAFEWAKVNLDQQLVCNPDLGCGLVAGFGRAGPGNFRPGFGWFFGGDAAINSFAMDGLGQFDLVRRGLSFLGAYQREDGKIPHEISHAAKRLPWFTDYPYTWFHGDTTPFWVLACAEYWRASGDGAFLREQWPRIVRAFRWSAATDTDGDALMENPTAGAGAIEVGGLGVGLHTDIYLAGVWVAALEGILGMAREIGDETTAGEARLLHEQARRSLDDLFWIEEAQTYAFALLEPAPPAMAPERKAAVEGEAAGAAAPADSGGIRRNAALTAWPSTALSFRLLDARRAAAALRAIGSSAITTDWGTRLLAEGHPLYEPLHYNNGAVWPFVTGFAALAHFRYHRAWSGYDLVRDVARTTFDFAHGRNPELLSGAFYQTLDTTVPHQFFATSMLVTPLVRGLLGLEVDAPNRGVSIEPHLPADWDSAGAVNLRVGDQRLSVSIARTDELFTVGVRRDGAADPGALSVRVAPALPLGARVRRITMNGRDLPVQVDESLHDVHPIADLALGDEAVVDIEYRGGVEVVPPAETLRPGGRSEGLRVVDFRRDDRDYLIVVEGLAGRVYPLELRTTERLRELRGARAGNRQGARIPLAVTIPGTGEDYARAEVRFRLR